MKGPAPLLMICDFCYSARCLETFKYVVWRGDALRLGPSHFTDRRIRVNSILVYDIANRRKERLADFHVDR